MKKFLVTMLLAVVTLFGTACNAESKAEPEFYTPVFDFLVKLDQISEESTTNTSGNELSSSEKEKCYEVFETINTYYGLTVPKPPVEKTTFKDYYGFSTGNSITVTATYNAEKKTIFLFSDLDDYSTSILAHEYIHYVADVLDNKSSMCQGFRYDKNGYAMGKYFDEGACNYVSTRVYPHPNDTSIYEYETHVANLFAVAIGEKEFAKAYFYGDVDTLRLDFNKAVETIYPCENFEGNEWDQFDTLIATQEAYFNFLKIIDTNPDLLRPAVFQMVNSMEEMMFFYGKQRDVKSQMQEITRTFLKNSYMIDWAGFSEIEKIAEIK